jgi:hypothetical protein
METPVVVLPTLKDHLEYAVCVANLERLNADLAQAKREAQHHSGIVRHGSDSHASEDVDKALKRFLKDEQEQKESRTRAEIRVAAIERAIQREERKIPELYRQAKDMVGHAAAAQFRPVVDKLFALRREIDEQWALRTAISQQLELILNDRTAPGYDSYDCGERFGVWGPVLGAIYGHPLIAAESVVQGQMQFKNEVHEPIRKEAISVIARLKDALWGNR